MTEAYRHSRRCKMCEFLMLFPPHLPEIRDVVSYVQNKDNLEKRALVIQCPKF